MGGQFIFFHGGKGSWGYVLGQSGPRMRTIWPSRKSAFNYEKGPFEPEFHEPAEMELNRGATNVLTHNYQPCQPTYKGADTMVGMMERRSCQCWSRVKSCVRASCSWQGTHHP